MRVPFWFRVRMWLCSLFVGPPREPWPAFVAFDSVQAIPAGATVSLRAQPQVLFKGREFSAEVDDMAPFVINDIKVGRDSIWTHVCSVRAVTLVGRRLGMPTAQVASDIIVSVSNIGPHPARFMGIIFGDSVQ